MTYYKDYFWKDGLPYGDQLQSDPTSSNPCYKIVMDPYRKRVSIEKYACGQFVKTVYDSALLNFRNLNQMEQQSWQKFTLKEAENSMECLIRDQDDRVLFIETYRFEQNHCKECLATSPQGVLLFIQKIHYKILGDLKNEVILFDANQHPVMQKIYEADPLTGDFTHLIEEIRVMKN